MLVGPDGKTPIQSERESPCPKCGRPVKDRVPSSGFGIPYLICLCTYDFEKRLVCQPVTL